MLHWAKIVAGDDDDTGDDDGDDDGEDCNGSPHVCHGIAPINAAALFRVLSRRPYNINNLVQQIKEVETKLLQN